MTSKQPEVCDVPDIIVDPSTTPNVTYKRGRFFGKGGFAKCYEITDIRTNEVYAGKVIPKKLLLKHNAREKVVQEINIHKSLKHPNVVGFSGFFENSGNVYIILELCKRRSMMELQRRRKKLTEPEARFYLHQVLLGVHYLHERNIIHRDLKLGNLFLNDNLQVKLGDFGLATIVEFKGERKKTLCGTPNYIAPEVLNKVGHSFEVDVWSIGCILYTLLVGRPPFETTSLKETYQRIRNCEYSLSKAALSPEAVNLIRRMLQSEPKARPTVKQLLDDPFFTSGYMPKELPTTCLSVEPRFDPAILAKHNQSAVSIKHPASYIPAVGTASRRPLTQVNQIDHRGDHIEAQSQPVGPTVMENSFKHMLMIKEQLTNLLDKPNLVKPNNSFLGEAEDPAAQALFWISTWVDYTDKYGFGYQLCDDSVAVAYNDGTKLILLANETDLQYIERDGQEHYHKMLSYPASLSKKMKLLDYFRRYMVEHLVKAGGRRLSKESDSMARMPYLCHWFRSRNCVIMFLTNGTLQINFSNHNKLIICPLMEAVTHITCDNIPHTYRFSTIEREGCSSVLHKGLETALVKVKAMIATTQPTNA
ncbi:Hypothetical predicted protein [Cloeon dipterum]|uniref:polo kinase n=1 Tax=Cloeon dipterum TaxID=197152 RepID=A0A8S1DZK1_9INSE|nr:Hypothetical predicted protein [Cloeon dipterum]